MPDISPDETESVWYLSFIYQVGSAWMIKGSVWGQILAVSGGEGMSIYPLILLPRIQTSGALPDNLRQSNSAQLGLHSF